jgi:hypothetical protein
MNKENAQKLMEKIALLLNEEEQGSSDSASIREGLAKINQRLDKIEDQLSSRNPQAEIHNFKPAHPSLEKLKFIEEMVDEIIYDQQIQKACLFEKNKPCDHCSMCNSRGF